MGDESASSSPIKHWAPCGCLLYAFVISIMLLTLGWFSWSSYASRQVQTAMDKIRAAGQPTTIEELNNFYHLAPHDPDTTLLWVEGMESLDTPTFRNTVKELPIVGDNEAKVRPPGEPWEDMEHVLDLLDQYADSLDKFHQAAQAGGSMRYALDFQDGLSMRLEDTQKVHSAAGLLSLEAYVRAHQGDAHGVAESIHAVFAAARSLEQQPFCLPQICYITVHGMGVDLLEQLLPYIQFAEDDLKMLRNDARSIRFAKGAHYALIGERVMGIQFFHDPSRLADVGIWMPLGASNEDLAFYLQLMTNAVDAASQPYPKALDEMAKVTTSLTKLHHSPLNRIRYPLMIEQQINPATFSSGIGSVVNRAACGIAKSRMADCAIAIELYRRDQGKLPNALADLVPEFLPAVPADPLDGQPLRYLVGKREYIIYSVGRDRKDDRGVALEGQRNGFDDVFHINLQTGQNPFQD